MSKNITSEDLELLDDLGVETAGDTKDSTAPRVQRIIAGFEEIKKFVAEHGRIPERGESRDIFERLYAVRLDSIRKSAECRDVLRDIDPDGLLEGEVTTNEVNLTDADILASLGVEAEPGGSITKLVHVRPQEEIKAAEEIAQRNRCEDFELFKPVFDAIQQDLQSGEKTSIKYRDDAEVEKGDVFILHGQKVLIGQLGEWFTTDYGRKDRRLRVIYDNGTESDLLLRSLQRALNKDKASRRIISGAQRNLFSDIEETDDTQVGRIYVLRSKSDHPFIA